MHGLHEDLTSFEHDVLGALPNLDSFEANFFEIFLDLITFIIVLSKVLVNVRTSKILLPFVLRRMFFKDLVHDSKHDTLFTSSPDCESGN